MCSYVEEFLSLRCAPDVLAAVGKVNKVEKEISEAMGIISALRPLLLNAPDKYVLVDIGSGNCLVPIIASHLFKLRWAFAVDERPKTIHTKVRRFTKLDMRVEEACHFGRVLDQVRTYEQPIQMILTGCHTCRDLARRVVDIVNFYWGCVDHVVLLPCCIGRICHKWTGLEFEKLTRYERWCLDLARGVGNGRKTNVFRDRKILSPANIIITAGPRAW